MVFAFEDLRREFETLNGFVAHDVEKLEHLDAEEPVELVRPKNLTGTESDMQPARASIILRIRGELPVEIEHRAVGNKDARTSRPKVGE